MRRALHLLILAAVLCCGLHLGNAVEAREQMAHQTADAEHHADHEDEGCGQPGDGAEGGHHHCPVAPAQPAALLAGAPIPRAMLGAMPIAVLHSRSLPPPIEPPLI